MCRPAQIAEGDCMNAQPKRRLLAGIALFATITAALGGVFVVQASPPADPALLDDLVGYWDLDETGGTRADSLGSNDLTSAIPPSWAAGKVGNAVQCGAPGQLAPIDSSDFITGDVDYTIAAWIYMSDLPAVGEIDTYLAKTSWDTGTSTYDGGYELVAWNQGAGTFFVFTVAGAAGGVVGSVSYTGTFEDDTWYFVVAWHDAASGEVGLSVDNGSDHTAATFGTPVDSSSDFVACGLNPYYVSPPEGRVDELGFWSRLLTEEERDVLWNDGDGCTYPFTAGCGPTPTPTGTATPLHVSVNYIDAGSFEFGGFANSPWDVQITNTAVRQLLGMGQPPVPSQDMVLWDSLARHGAICGTNAAIILAGSPEDDLRTGQLSQDFEWPGGSMYISLLGKTVGSTKGNISLYNLDSGTIFSIDPHFTNPTSDWLTARYVYNLDSGRYRLTFSATGTSGQFGWLAIDDVNVRSGWFKNECDAPPVPGLVPAQQVPQFPTPIPWTPAPPTQWVFWASPTPLGGPTLEPTPYIWPTPIPRTPLAPPPDYPPGVNILRNGSFESLFNFLYWAPSRLTRKTFTGGVEGRAYATLDTGVQPPALSQHWRMRYPQVAYVSLWADSNSHVVIAIREATSGNFKAVWRIDTGPTTGWAKYEFVTPSLPAGQYSLELTNVYLRNAEVDEVAITVGVPYPYPTHFPEIEQSSEGQATATAYVNYVATSNAAALATANAQATQDVHDNQTQVAIFTQFAQTQAAATFTYNQGGTATRQSYSATQTAQAIINSQAMTATALWYQINAQLTQAAYTQIASTSQANSAIQTQAALQTQIVQTSQAQFSALQTAIYLTAHAPAALTATAQSIINTAQAPFYATQTAIAYLQTQIVATSQGTPPPPSPTVDVVLATQQALVVPEQPEPWWAAVCGRPPNALNLAWWLDYEVCRILSWFAWSPVNTTQVITWQVEATIYEPGGMIDELVQSLNVARAIWSAVDWEDTGACNSETLDLGSVFIPAQGILQGNFTIGPGEPIELDCLTPLRPFLGDGIADGVCGAISILCQRGIMVWVQFAFDGGLVALFIVYLQRAWIAKATQG